MDRQTCELAIDDVTGAVLRALARAETPTSAALTLLLRRFAATTRDDVREALEPALARGLDVCQASKPVERPGWLSLFVEAATASEDARLLEAAADLIEDIRDEWGRRTEVGPLALGIEACLSAEMRFTTRGGPAPIPGLEAVARDGIDELERLVAGAYRPGEGLASRLGEAAGGRGRVVDHMAAASALLTAYWRSGRLPYSMLAEELVQHARRTAWDARASVFSDGDPGAPPFAVNCEAARVLCRLAVLHDRDDYRRAAVVAPAADYRGDVSAMLDWLGSRSEAQDMRGAAFGLAAAEWLEMPL